MAFNAGEIITRFSANTTDFKRGVSEAKGGVKSFSSASSAAFGAVAKGAAIVTTAVTGIAIATAGMAIKGAAQMEQFEVAFKTLLGSEEAANEALNRIKADAKATPFELPGLIKANQLLISAGINSGDAADAVIALGNAVSATGGGDEELSRLALNLQQIRSVGNATSLDIKQFAFAGIPIFDLLAESMGKSVEEIKKLDASEITYDKIVDALKAAGGEGGRFAGAMENQSKTFNGIMSNIKDTFNITLSDLAKQSGLFDFAKDKLQGFLSLIEKAPAIIGGLIAIFKDRNITGDFLRALGIAEDDDRVTILLNLRDKIIDFFNRIKNGAIELWKKAQPILNQFLDFLSKNWKETLVGVGAVVVAMFIAWAIAATSAAVATIVAAAPVIAVFLAIGVAAAFLFKAWTNNWGGIQEKTRAVVDWFMGTAWPIIKQFFFFLRDGFIEVLNKYIIPFSKTAIIWAGKFIQFLVAAWAIIWPILQAIGAGFMWLLTHIIIPVAKNMIKNLKITFAALGWIWANMISPVLSLIGAAVAWLAVHIVGWLVNAFVRVKNNAQTLWNLIRKFIIEPLQGAWNWINNTFKVKERLENMWNGIRDFFVSQKDSIKNALLAPFIEAKNNIEQIANDFKAQADKINPFHRESPSLIDNVTKGIQVIKDAYNSLGDVSMTPVVNMATAQGAITASIEANPILSKKEVNLNIKNNYGDEMGLRRLTEDIKREMNRLDQSEGK